MNKDLDERLVPQGEYREAQNIQISSSEDSDVGAIENVLGNKLAYNDKIDWPTGYTSPSGNNSGDTTIGAYSDTPNNRIFWFTTNFSSDSTNTIQKMERAGVGNYCSVIMKDGDAEPVEIATGSWLNFNKKKLITGINVLENYLCWTDDYNQPRMIDLDIADPNSPKYDRNYYFGTGGGSQYTKCEARIGVGKVAPYLEPMLNETNVVIGTGAHSRGDGTTLLRDGDVKSKYLEDKFVRFAYRYKFKDGQYSVISPFTQSVFKPLNAGVLKHAPDQVNATAADTGTGDEPKVPVSVEDVWEDTVVPIMQNAYNKVIMRIPLPSIDEHGSTNNPDGNNGTESYLSNSVYVANPFNIKSVEILAKESDGLGVKLVDTINIEDAGVTIETYYVATGSATVVANGNHTNDNTLEVDALNGVEAGWIIDNMSTSVLGSEGRLYVASVSGTTIRLQNQAGTFNHDTGAGGGITCSDDASLTFKKAYYRHALKYTYTSKEPYKVLPEKQLLRTSDKIPVRAKAQEVVSNRLVYGNITQNLTLPKDTSNNEGIDYTVSYDKKGDAEFGQTVGVIQNNDEMYKYHNIKQRRTYQVGIVLSDIWGRQSPVILSTHTSTDGTDTVTVGASAEDLSAKYSSAYSWSTNQAAYGQALTITFHDERIVPEEDLYHHETNPHGWYSWRLVVKQQEQDYYNVYTNHPANSWTTKGFTTTSPNTIGGDQDTSRSGRTWLTLYGDNINKVPRSVTQSDETRPGIAGCEVRLYPKVVQGADSGDTPSYKSVIGNINQEYMKVISIGSAIEQGLWSDVNEGNTGVDRVRVYKFVRDNDKNPLVAELPNLRTEQVAVTTGDVDIDSSAEGVNTPAGYPKANVSGLTVFETEPVKSKLDIFYETSTGGLLRDLNEQITLQSGGPTGLALSAVTAGTTSAPTFVESENSGKELATLTATASTGSITSYQLVTAVDGNGNDVSSKFIVYNSSGSTWKIKTNGTFAFNNITPQDTFTLTIKVSQTDGTSTNGDFDFSVTNSAPTITSGTGVIPSGSGSGVVIGSVSAVNGSADTTLKTKFITPGNVTEPSGGATIAGLEIVQPSDGTIRLQTTSSYNETTLFGSNTTKTVTLNITDNGSLSASNTFVITKLAGYQTSGYAASSESSACNLLCIASSMTVYIDEATGSTPSDSGIHYNNIVYTDAAMTNRLYAGSTGWFVWKNNEHAWYVVNGVLNADNGECDDC